MEGRQVAQDSRIRVGVVGLGLIAQAVHLPNLHTLRESFEVVHVCDASDSRARLIAQGLPGDVRASTDWADVLADPEVEAVIVLTPGSHGDVVLAALAAGKHVFTEKPLAYSLAETDRISQSAQERGLVVQVGYMKMHDPAVARSREAIASIGIPRVVRVTVLHPTDECQFEHVNLLAADDPDTRIIERGVNYSAEQLVDALGESEPGLVALYENVLLGSVIHEMSLLRALGFELPDRFEFVSVEPALGQAAPDGPPRILAVARLSNGAALHLSWNWVPDYPEYTEEVAVFGSAGRVFLELPGPYLAAHRARVRVQRMDGEHRADATYFSGHVTAFVVELEAFARSVRTGAPILSDVAGARRDLEALQQIMVAAGNREGLSVAAEVGTGIGSS